MAEALTAAAVLAILAALWNIRRARRTMAQLERMLDEAIEGRFSERRFDESRLSRAESRLSHYLSASAISAVRVSEEKAKLQSLIADISHQTRTPLSNILLYAQLLEEQDLPDKSRDCIAALAGQTRKLQSLLEALVRTSRLETGVLTFHPEKRPLCPMLEGAVEQFAPQAAGKQIILTLEPTEAQAVYDAKWTAEAVCNLLDNAVKYTPAGGRITVRVVPFPLFCRVDVADSGPGVPEAEQAKIFQRFYRSAAVHETEGVGVGLYLARQIAEGQGGYIRVASRPGHGAVFSLCLPAG